MIRKAGPELLLCALLLVSSCALPSGQGLMYGPMSLDSGDGRGPLPYSGERVPAVDLGTREYRFELPFSLKGAREQMALIIGPTAYPYLLRLNGSLLYRYGEAPDRKRNYSSSLVQLPEGLLQEDNLIRVEAQAGSERGRLMELSLAPLEEASRYVYWRNFFMTQLVTAGFAIGIILFIYFMALFLLDPGRDLRYLWFSIFCLCFAASYVNIVFNYFAASDSLLTKVGRTGFFFCVSLFSFFVMEFTGLLAKRLWIKALILSGALLASVYVVAQSSFQAVNAAFFFAMRFAIAPQLLFCAALIFAAIVKGGMKQYRILAIGFAGVLGTSVYDTFFETSERIPYAWTLIYGFLWLVLCVFLELAFKNAKISLTAQAQAQDLHRKNELLKNVLKHLRAGSDNLSTSTEELAVSTREISFTGNQQAAAVKEIVSTMEDANSLLGKISEKSSSVHSDSEATALKADGGVAKVRTALEKLEAVIGRISESISMITEFNDQLGSITEIVKFIEGIATQIRIIAFNASLEAVAAGDAGKNFRIVAEEVKRLADSTMASVKSIRARVTSLISTSDEVVKTARDGYMSLEQSWDIASGIGTSFSGIAQAADSSARATADIDASIREEKAAFEQIVQTLKEISAGITNFVESANHTSDTTNRLDSIAEHLHRLIIESSEEFSDEGPAKAKEA